MKNYLFTYYDRAAGIYSAPILSVNRPVAIRNFVNVMSHQDNSVVCRDMELYEIGSFDSETAEIESCKPSLVVRYEEYISNESKQ